MSLNKVMLIGRLGERPAQHEDDNGPKRVGLSIVTEMADWFDVQTGKAGNRDEWHRVLVVRPDLVDMAMQDLTLDDHIYVEGQLQTRSWQDETFELRSLTQIILSRDSDQIRRLSPPDGQDAEDGGLGKADAKMPLTRFGNRPVRLDQGETGCV